MPTHHSVERFYVSFGVGYRHEPHPVLGDRPDLPDALWWIEERDEMAARRWLIENIGREFAFVYTEDEIDGIGSHWTGGIRDNLKEMVA